MSLLKKYFTYKTPNEMAQIQEVGLKIIILYVWLWMIFTTLQKKTLKICQRVMIKNKLKCWVLLV